MKLAKIAGPLVLLGCVLLLFSLSACSSINEAGIYVGEGPEPKAGPPPHAPAHGYRAKHTYHYYPDAHVYFDIGTGMYFYLDGGEWKISASLPRDLHVCLGDHVTIEMDSDRPYTEFEYHKQKYPPGQTKKKNKGKKW
ncbi:MAG: hypothetical protein JSV16_14845 [Candidatus Hydrogenedentota bacterium]|nr:MAG: hypothetical protein JSV16_14845 [Candidatus Hydrogenedentota bacterium]